MQNNNQQNSQQKNQQGKSILVINSEELMKKSLNQITEQHLMSVEEYQQHQKILERFERAKQIRNARYKYYDGMTFVEDYSTNEDLKNTFLTPKQNDSEVRVNVGLGEKKLDAVKNELLVMNLKHEIRAFDQSDLEIQELGDDMADIVTRTNEVEKEDDVMEEIIDELLSQRVVYVRETFQPQTFMRGQETIAIAKKELVSGLKVFPGSWTIPAYKWDDQPYIVTYDCVGYETAKSYYGNLENFKHVKPNGKERTEYLGGAYSYQFGELQDGECEIILYESLPDNEQQLYINGVPMYEPGKKLDSSCLRYSLRAYSTKSMSRNFLGGRPLTAMAKTMTGLANETIRLMIRKFQQTIEPPMASPKAGKIFSHRIFDPGSWAQGMRKADFEKLIDHQGVTQGEFQMYNLIEQKVEEFIGTPNVAQGIQATREMSATEVLTMTKQFLKQLGGIVATMMRVKRDLTEMRIYNVLENYLDPQKRKYDELAEKVEDVYRSFTIKNSNVDGNRKGRKIIRITDRDLSPEEERGIYDLEEMEKSKGNLVRIKYINKEKLKKIPIFWYVNIFTEDKEGTAFDKVTFQDQLQQASNVSQLTGKRLNPDVVTETFERKWKAKDWFNVQAPEEMMGQEEEGTAADAQNLLKELEGLGQQGNLGDQIPRGLRGASTSVDSNIAAQEAVAPV